VLGLLASRAAMPQSTFVAYPVGDAGAAATALRLCCGLCCLSCGALLMDEVMATNTALELPATLAGRAVAIWEAWQPTGRDAFFYKTELAAGG